MQPDSDPATGPNTEAAGEAAAESVVLDHSDLAGFTANSPSIRHMLDKIDALEAGIVELHDADHSGPIQWCPNILCRTMQDWR